MTVVWTQQELISATGGDFLHGGGADEEFGAVVLPLNFVRAGSILVHVDAASWPEKQRRGSGQAEMDLDEVVAVGHKRGAALVIASKPPTRPSVIPILLVPNTYEALIALARFARARFQGRVIAVTGTAGKIATRDILVRLLARIGKTSGPHGNWNSVSGIAMGVASLPADGAFAVIEIGGGTLAGSRRRTLDMIRHDDAIITTIGINHTSRSSTPAVTAKVMARLFQALPPSGRAYWPRDIAEVDILQAAVGDRQIRVVGDPALSTIALEAMECGLDWMRLKVTADRYTQEIKTQATVSGPLTNLALAAQCAYDLGVPAETIAEVIADYSPYKRKNEWVHLNIRGKSVVMLDDCHNATLISFENVLSRLRKFKDGKRLRILIVGRVAYNEGNEEATYAGLARMICDCDPFAVILQDVGLDLLAKALLGKTPVLRAQSPSDAVALVETLIHDDSLILLKGLRRDTRIRDLSKLLRKSGAPQTRKVVSEVLTRLPPIEASALDAVSNAHRIARRVEGDPSIGILGDTYLGEYYVGKMKSARRRHHPLHDGNYDAAFEHVDSFLRVNDLNIANLETPLTTAAVSPFAEMRPYPHWARPEETLSCLLRHRIDAVTLANNHLYDYGEVGVLETLAACETSPLVAFGAGRSASDAARPLVIETRLRAADDQVGVGRRVVIFAGFVYRKVVDRRFAAYARDRHPGCFPLQGTALVGAIRHVRSLHDQAVILVIPHWTRDYQWASRQQRDFAEEVFAAGADLVIGHGAHMLQQVERFGDRVAVHSVGNFVFNAPGRYASMFAPPFSAAIRLMLPLRDPDAGILRLYPILSDNRITGYRPRFLTETEADEFMALYAHLGFIPHDARSGTDTVGYFLELRFK